MPFSCINLLNSAIQITPKTKNKAITACCDCKDNRNNETNKAPDTALTISSFTSRF